MLLASHYHLLIVGLDQWRMELLFVVVVVVVVVVV